MSAVLSRTYRVIDGEESHALTVTWGEPFAASDIEWVCQVTFDEVGGSSRQFSSRGADAVQALYIGLCMAATELLTWPGEVCWIERDDDLGLPTSQFLRYLVDERAQRYRTSR